MSYFRQDKLPRLKFVPARMMHCIFRIFPAVQESRSYAFIRQFFFLAQQDCLVEVLELSLSAFGVSVHTHGTEMTSYLTFSCVSGHYVNVQFKVLTRSAKKTLCAALTTMSVMKYWQAVQNIEDQNSG